MDNIIPLQDFGLINKHGSPMVGSRAMSKKVGYVYLFAGKQGVKIGSTTNKERRINELRHMSGNDQADVFFSVECSNYRSIESSLHKEFAAKRIFGEWFHAGMDEAKTALYKHKFNPPTTETEIDYNDVFWEIYNVLTPVHTPSRCITIWENGLCDTDGDLSGDENQKICDACTRPVYIEKLKNIGINPFPWTAKNQHRVDNDG